MHVFSSGKNPYKLMPEANKTKTPGTLGNKGNRKLS
jgi:hypothetical protein